MMGYKNQRLVQMKLNSLQSLRRLEDVGSVPSLRPLVYQRVTIDKSLMSEIDLILYSTNLCLFSARILRNEIQIPNRDETLTKVNNEIMKLYNLLSKKDFILHSEYAHKDTKQFFKSVGLKPKHINTDRTK